MEIQLNHITNAMEIHSKYVGHAMEILKMQCKYIRNTCNMSMEIHGKCNGRKYVGIAMKY